MNSSLLRSQAEVWAQRLGGEMLVNVTTRIFWLVQPRKSLPPTTLDLEKSSRDVSQTPETRPTLKYIASYQVQSPSSEGRGSLSLTFDDSLTMPGCHSVFYFPINTSQGVGLEMKWALPPRPPLCGQVSQGSWTEPTYPHAPHFKGHPNQ